MSRDAAIDLPPTVPPPGFIMSAWMGLAVLLLLTVSAFLLMDLGWNYGTPGGNPLEKMHPATVMLALALVAAATLNGNPVTSFLSTAERHPGLLIYLAGIGLLMLHAMRWAGLPVTTFIDTFLAPAIVFLVFEKVPEKRARGLAWIIHLFFVANAALGVAELALGFRTTPLYIDGIETEDEWRSSALLGHPLGNALLTGAYMVAVAAGGGRDLPGWLRPIALVVTAAGMVSFGGRAATVFAILFLLGLLLLRMGAIAGGAKFDRRALLSIFFLMPVLLLGVALAADAGSFDLFIGRFIDDEGSASTRVEMFELFKHISTYDLLFGPDMGQVVSLMGHYGLEYGIESFWVAMVLQHGLLVAGIFFVTLFFFCREIVRATGPGTTATLLYFFAVASTSVGLSVKSPAFAIFLLLPMVLLRRRTPEASRGWCADTPVAIDDTRRLKAV